MIDKNIFRAYDIRGQAMGDQINITEETAYLIGRGIATLLERKGLSRMVLGRDGRLTSPALHKAFVKGALESGLHLFDIGLATSPMIYFASCLPEYDCACNITASHNPKQYNGFKFVANNAHSIYGEDLQELLRIIRSGEFTNKPGSYTETKVADRYIESLQAMVNIQRPLKIVVDTGNGVAGAFVKDLFNLAKIEAEFLFIELDGDFPNHSANPEKAENLKDLSAKVVELGADLGIGFDGDGDRVGFVDENGQHYSLDLIVMLFARDALSRNPGRPVIFDVKCSKVVENDIREHGGKPIRTKTGHSHIENAMHEKNAIFGGEISGHMFFKENYYGFDDAFLAALKFIEILASDNKPLSAYFEGLPKVFNTPEIRLQTQDDRKFLIVDNVLQKLEAKGTKVLTIDGVFAEYDEVSWAALRASNTAAQLTLRFESDSQQKLDEILQEFYLMLKQENNLDLAPLAKFLK